jgi:hypothetical protein
LVLLSPHKSKLFREKLVYFFSLVGDIDPVSAETNTMTQAPKAHGRLCFCELCVPAWAALSAAPQPEQSQGGDDDDESGVQISLTEWAERAVAPLIARQ